MMMKLNKEQRKELEELISCASKVIKDVYTVGVKTHDGSYKDYGIQEHIAHAQKHLHNVGKESAEDDLAHALCRSAMAITVRQLDKDKGCSIFIKNYKTNLAKNTIMLWLFQNRYKIEKNICPKCNEHITNRQKKRLLKIISNWIIEYNSQGRYPKHRV
jgi:hypothetical protein